MTAPRRILRVGLYSDAPLAGGAERYLEVLVGAFPRNEIQASVVLATEPALDATAARFVAQNVRVTRLPRVAKLSNLSAFLRVFGHLAWNRPEILHFNLVDPRACNAAIVAAKLSGHRQIVTTEHLPHSPFDSLATPLRHRIAMAVVRRHIVVSRASREALIARGVPPDMVTTVHNGVALPTEIDPAARARARHELGAANDEVVIGFAGRLTAQKRGRFFVEAMAAVVAGAPTVRAVVLGDGDERPSLEALAREIGVAERVRFFGHRADARELFRGFDALAVTSRYEGLPLTILECMALGVPVVAPRIPGMDEAVEHGITGMLFDPDDRAGLVSAILGLAGDPPTRTTLGAAGRRRAMSEFSIESMVWRTVDVYRSLVPG